MIKKTSLLTLFCALVCGCYDKGYLPAIRNGLDTEVVVLIVYSDGSSSRNVWGPCMDAFIGVPEDSEKRLAAIEIRHESELIRRYDEREILDLIEEQEAHSGYSAWVIHQNGVSLETAPNSSCQ